MTNIKFNYFYRCIGNYKKYSSVIFANPTNIEVDEIEAFVKSKLIDETWLYAHEWQLPEIFTDIVDFRVDPSWHEFDSLEYTEEEQLNKKFKLADLIERVSAIKKHQ